MGSKVKSGSLNYLLVVYSAPQDADSLSLKVCWGQNSRDFVISYEDIWLSAFLSSAFHYRQAANLQPCGGRRGQGKKSMGGCPAMSTCFLPVLSKSEELLKVGQTLCMLPLWRSLSHLGRAIIVLFSAYSGELKGDNYGDIDVKTSIRNWSFSPAAVYWWCTGCVHQDMLACRFVTKLDIMARPPPSEPIEHICTSPANPSRARNLAGGCMKLWWGGLMSNSSDGAAGNQLARASSHLLGIGSASCRLVNHHSASLHIQMHQAARYIIYRGLSPSLDLNQSWLQPGHMFWVCLFNEDPFQVLMRLQKWTFCWQGNCFICQASEQTMPTNC